VDGATPFSVPLAVQAGAAGLTQENDIPPVKILSAKALKTEVKVGETFVLAVEVEIPQGWHIYPTYPTTTGELTAVEFPGVESAGKAEEPKAKVHPAEGIEKAYEYHDGTVTFKFPLRLKSDAKPGPLELNGQLSYQICNPKKCAPTKTPVSFKITVLEGKVVPSPAEQGDAAQRRAQGVLEERGYLGFLLLAVGGGLISLVMPCVYPIIPITITYFIKQGGGSRGKSLFLSSAYSAGIILAFTGIGFVFSLLTGEDGARVFAANVWVNIAVALLFLWFAFSLFGLYEISLPSWLVTGATGQRRQGAGGAFILGVLFSVVTFTCTIPIAATILAVAASAGAGNRFAGFIAMLAYSGTMALPFFLLGLFPNLLTGVRKSGGDWLHTVKVTMGFAELALALVYLAKADVVSGWGILTRPLMIAIWVTVLIFMALYLLRVFQIKGDETDPAPTEAEGQPPARRQVGIARMLIAMGLGVLAVVFATGFSGRALGQLDILLPPNLDSLTAGVGSSGPAERAIGTYAGALEEGRKTGKPIFLEFTGVTCLNCLQMKGTVLASPVVRAEIRNFVFGELYTDRRSDPRFREIDTENARVLKEKFGSAALPVYITLGPDGAQRSFIEGKVSEAEFLEFLRKGLNPPASQGGGGR
jgi:thiol:disulfide interchange protein DsbD